MSYDDQTANNINYLMTVCGEAAKESGWHGDRPTGTDRAEFDESDVRALRNWQGMKLMLMVSELAEAVEELRKGKTANETYYPTAEPPFTLVAEMGNYKNAKAEYAEFIKDRPIKPEGVPSELADTLIRIMDFCYTEGIDIGSMVMEKLAFNATRGHKHGKVV